MTELTPAERALRDVLVELIDVVHQLADDVSRIPDAVADVSPSLRTLERRLYALPVELGTDDLDREP